MLNIDFIFHLLKLLTTMFGFEMYFFPKNWYLLTMITNTIFIINLTLKWTLSVTILLEPSWLKNIICFLLLSYNQIRTIKWPPIIFSKQYLLTTKKIRLYISRKTINETIICFWLLFLAGSKVWDPDLYHIPTRV
jgi:hypothetical protein